MTGNAIGNAPSGNKATLLGIEKFPIDGSQYALISAIAEYERTLTQILTGKTLNLTNNTLTGTSAQLRTAISDETGTGVAVFNDTPTILTPTIASFANATHAHKSAAGGGQINTYVVLKLSTPGITTPADATTYHFATETSLTTTEAQHLNVIVPIAGTIIAAYVSFRNNTTGSAETSTIYLRINATTDVIISSAVTNNSAVTNFSNTGLSQAVSAGDQLRGKWITPTWASDPATVAISITVLMTASVV